MLKTSSCLVQSEVTHPQKEGPPIGEFSLLASGGLALLPSRGLAVPHSGGLAVPHSGGLAVPLGPDHSQPLEQNGNINQLDGAGEDELDVTTSFKCEPCDKQFKSLKSLRKHLSSSAWSRSH